MKILSIPSKTIYVDFSNRVIYRKKSIFLRIVEKFRLLEIFLGAFALADIYIFIIICFTFCQR